MQKLVYLVAATLDGQIAEGDGTFGCFNLVGDAHHADYLASLQEFSSVVMGRKTYEVGLRAGVTDPYPGLDTYVCSRALLAAPHPRVRLVSEDPSAFVRDLKQTEGNGIYLCGGASLAGQLLAAGLIDEIRVKLNPLLIGAGIPLFAAVPAPRLLKLTATKAYPNGVLLLTYQL
ncbi:MAG TPA: dihydrofolate reductase [Solibacterales bacterium]|nr:dihydrofolate reductase [Bryobacterales bacterium]